MELNDELNSLRITSVRVVARRLGVITSSERITELLRSGLSLQATLRALIDEQGFFARLFGKLWVRVRPEGPLNG
jgi:hypothetical protein